MTVIVRDSDPSPSVHEAISPYLRRPLRSLKEYLKERSRARTQPERAPPVEKDPLEQTGQRESTDGDDESGQ